MKNDLHKTVMRHGLLVRSVALFFVLFTFADIAYPEVFCPDEFGATPIARRTQAAREDGEQRAASRSAAVSTSDDTRHDSTPEQSNHEEDCFCCCAHVLPGMIFGVSHSCGVKPPLPTPSRHDSRLKSFPQSTFRPPRIV